MQIDELDVNLDNITTMSKSELTDIKDKIQAALTSANMELPSISCVAGKPKIKYLREEEVVGNAIKHRQYCDSLQESLKIVEAEIAQRTNNARSYNKFRFFKNVRELCKKKDVKLGTIEKEANVAQGYMSRLDKETNVSEPTLDFVVTAAKMLSVSVDDLLKKDFNSLSPNETYLSNFFERLIEDTRKDELNWLYGKPDVLNTLSCDDNTNPFRSLFISDRFYTANKMPIQRKEDCVTMLSNTYGSSTWIDNNCFVIVFGKEATIYVMSVKDGAVTPSESVREIWMSVENSYPKYLACSNDRNLGYLVENLYGVLTDNMKTPTISKDLRSFIDNYLKGIYQD